MYRKESFKKIKKSSPVDKKDEAEGSLQRLWRGSYDRQNCLRLVLSPEIKTKVIKVQKNEWVKDKHVLSVTKWVNEGEICYTRN